MFIHHTEIDGTMNKTKYLPAELYSIKQYDQNPTILKKIISSHFCV